MFYSKTTGGFYDESIHGSGMLEIPDLSWVRPTIQTPQDDGTGGTVMVEVPDESAIHPTITVPNPDCKIPADAVEITAVEHSALLDAQSAGRVIQADQNGKPVAVDPPPPSLETVKASKTAEINAACAAAIVGGFTSSALGAPHSYDSALEDQLNLIGAVGLGIDLTYRCADAAGIKSFRQHTAAQLKQVATDGAAIKLAALEKAATLKAQVQVAVDAASIEAVAW